MALAETHMRFTCPLGNFTRTRCKLGRKVRLFTLTNCKPMPPDFLLMPLRMIIPPLRGRLPVIAQILDMGTLLGKERKHHEKPLTASHFLVQALLFAGPKD
jgi:hypothetical protein